MFDDTGWLTHIWNEQLEILLLLNMELNEVVLLSRKNDLLLGIVISLESGCIVFVEVWRQDLWRVFFCWNLDAVWYEFKLSVFLWLDNRDTCNGWILEFKRFVIDVFLPEWLETLDLDFLFWRFSKFNNRAAFERNSPSSRRTYPTQNWISYHLLH